MNIPKPGQFVFIIQNDCVNLKKVKDVARGDGGLYLPQHGDDCYVSFDRRRGTNWYKHDEVYPDLLDAQSVLALKFRRRAEACILQAEKLEACVAQANEAKRKAGYA